MPTELHIALQQHYAEGTGEIEARHGRYKLDVLRDGVAYEIQTGSFYKIRNKLEVLAKLMPVVVVAPMPETKIVVRVDPETGEELSSRRSPKKYSPMDAFSELRHISHLLPHENITLHILKTIERELRTPDGQGSKYRRRVSLVGRELVEIVEVLKFEEPEDYLVFLPLNLPREFSVADLAQASGINRWLAGHLSYVLHQCGTIERVGKRGNAYLYKSIGPVGPADAEDDPGWVEVRCSECDLMGFEAIAGSVVRWRCGKCKSLQVWPGQAG